jgi:hypothetical protein
VPTKTGAPILQSSILQCESLLRPSFDHASTDNSPQLFSVQFGPVMPPKRTRFRQSVCRVGLEGADFHRESIFAFGIVSSKSQQIFEPHTELGIGVNYFAKLEIASDLVGCCAGQFATTVRSTVPSPNPDSLPARISPPRSARVCPRQTYGLPARASRSSPAQSKTTGGTRSVAARPG